MATIELIIIGIPLLLYVLCLIWLNNIIRGHIENKRERKKWKKDNRINKLVGQLFFPFFLASALLASLISNKILLDKKWDIVYLISKSIILILAFFLAYISLNLININLKSLRLKSKLKEKNKSKINE